MARTVKINENFTLTYSSREDSTGDAVMDVTVNFDNPKDDNAIVTRLNVWLKSIGRENIIAELKSGK